MKNLLSNLTALLTLASLIILIVGIILNSQLIGLVAGFYLISGISLNVVFNSCNLLKS